MDHFFATIYIEKTMLMIQVEAISARGQASFFCDAHLLGGLSEIIKQMKETAAP